MTTSNVHRPTWLRPIILCFGLSTWLGIACLNSDSLHQHVVQRLTLGVLLFLWLGMWAFFVWLNWANDTTLAASLSAGLLVIMVYLAIPFFQRFEVTRQALKCYMWRGPIALRWESLAKVYRSPSGKKFALVGPQARIVIPPDVRIQSGHAFMWLVTDRI